MRFGLIGDAYSSRSLNVACQRTVNLYPEVLEREDGQKKIVLYGTPGLSLFSYLSTEPMRETHVMNGVLYAVVGGKFYTINSAGVKTEKGTLVTSAGRVSMDNNGTQIMIVDGTAGYIYTIATDTFAKITDPDFPGANMVTFLDGYFVFNKPGTGQFMITGLYDGMAIDALDIATAEAYPDLLTSLINDHRELWLFGEYSTEVWYNSGNASFPFERVQGAVIEKGIAARWSVAKMDNSLFWLAKDKNGEGYVVRANGYQPQVISTRAIEHQIASYSDISDAWGYAYTQNGHGFYVITFPTGNATWAYDVTTGMWHERSSRNVQGEFKRHLANTYAFAYGKHLVGDFEDGDIYKMDMAVYTDNGEPIIRTRRTMHIGDEQKNLFYHRLQIEMEMGIGDFNYASNSFYGYLADGYYYADGSIAAGGDPIPGTSVNPQAMLRWSDDGGHTWSNEHWVTIGKQGEYGKRAVWKRLGRSRNRVFELNLTDPVKTVLIDANLELTRGRH